MYHKTALWNIFLIILLALLLTRPASIVSAGTNVWTSIGPSGGRILSLAIDPSSPATLYAGTSDGGVFKSTDGGGTWNPANTDLTNTYVTALAIDPSTPATLYAGTSGGVFKSTDGGGSWSAANTGLTDTDVHALAIDPSTPTTLFAGTGTEDCLDYDCVVDGDLFKSTNGGGKWTSAGLPNTEVTALAIDPVTPTTLYAGGNREICCVHGGGHAPVAGVFISMDSGGTWSDSSYLFYNEDGQVTALAIDPVTPSTLYAGTDVRGVYKSTHSGGSWSSIVNGLGVSSVMSLGIDPSTPATLYAGLDDGTLFKSTDGGGRWSPASTGLTGYSVRALAIDPSTPATLYAGTDGGGVFSIQQVQPGSFAKDSPFNRAAGVATNPTLSWGSSRGAASYEYCYDVTNDNACSRWTSVDANTSVTLTGLNIGVTYYWQVRAVSIGGTTEADGGTWRSFTTVTAPPGAFNKTGPDNTAAGVPVYPTLSWGSSGEATSYEYCYDMTDDNACSGWTSAGASTRIRLSGLHLNTTYYWQVRAVNVLGVIDADGGAWWSFTTTDSNKIFLPAVKK